MIFDFTLKIYLEDEDLSIQSNLSATKENGKRKVKN